MVLDNHRLAIHAAIKTALAADKQRIRMVRIRDTLHTTEIRISEAMTTASFWFTTESLAWTMPRPGCLASRSSSGSTNAR